MSHHLRSSKSMNDAERAYIAFLTQFMGSAFFSNKNNSYHPFYKDYWALKTQLIKELGEGADNTKVFTDALAQTTALMNAYTLSQSSKKKGDPLLTFGNFSDIGSVKVREDIEGRLGALKTIEKGKRRKGKKTESIISELCIASWVSPQCSDFMALQEDSMPDFVCIGKKLAIECKAYVEANSVENFLDKHISKANKQLGKANADYGVEMTGILALDLTRYFATREPKLVSGTVRIYPEEYFSALDAEIVARISERENIHWVIYYWDEVFPFPTTTLVKQDRISRWVRSPEIQPSYPPLESYGLSVGMNLRRAPMIPNYGRNLPCCCGSGKRFKACHGRVR